ncbi:MAG: DUF1648 domain-containing protein [Chloroflexi bacterium]|nr:DUF1648 domain-containing protein [Chloroflexota bacterium]
MRPSRLALLTLTLLVLLELAYFYPRLPDTVASHFNAAGQADGWSSKAAFIQVNAVIILLLAILFPGISWLVARLPVGLINMPNREYWFAEERRAATLSTIQQQMEWLGVATLLLLIAILQVSIVASLTPGAAMSAAAMWLPLAGYLIFMVVWTATFIGRFYRKT